MNGGKRMGDEATELYRRATNVLMKKNPLIHFAYANFEEGRGRYEKAHTIYQKLTDIRELDPTLTFIQYMRFARRLVIFYRKWKHFYPYLNFFYGCFFRHFVFGLMSELFFCTFFCTFF